MQSPNQDSKFGREVIFIKNKKTIRKIILLVLAVLIIYTAHQEFQVMFEEEEIFPADTLTEQKYLSDYFSELADSPTNPEVYIFEGEEEGGSALILGGNHPNEPAWQIAPILMMENIEVEKGRVIFIPRANPSAFTHHTPQEAYPQTISLPTEDGEEREFRFGSRDTNPLHQWPDPDVYVHPSGQRLAGSETRNLNRAFPGRPDGNTTERLAHGITELVRQEEIDLAFDLHEASPEYPVVNAIVSYPTGMELASFVSMDLEMKGISISLEPSPEGLRGLSHRELGDHTDTWPYLLETANPAMGRLRGPTNEELVLTGQDEFYESADELGMLYVPWDEEGWPLDKRVARHVVTIMEFFTAYEEIDPDNPIMVSEVPEYEDIINEGVGKFLNTP